VFALLCTKKRRKEGAKKTDMIGERGVVVGSHRGIGVAPGAKRKAQKRLRLPDGKGSPLLASGFARSARLRPRVVQQSPQPLRPKAPRIHGSSVSSRKPGTHGIVLLAAGRFLDPMMVWM